MINTCAGGVFDLQENHAKVTKTLDNLTSVVAGWKSDQDRLASKVDATAEGVAQLKKEFEEFRRQADARPSKCPRQRSRSPGRGGCHCAIGRYNEKRDGLLRKGDEVWLCPRHGGEPKLKRYFIAMNRCGFSELSNDRGGKVKHGSAVRKHEIFIKRDLCQSCRRGR